MTTHKKDVTVIVPVYNSAGTLDELVERVSATLQSFCSTYEIILINDASRDLSWPKIQQLVSSNNCVTGINLSRNSGQHNAVLCGIRAAKFDYIATLDDDLQYNPEDIPALFEKLDEGYDVIYGSPKKQQHGFLRTAASQITKFCLKTLMGAEIAPHISPFRVFKTKLRNAFCDASGDVSLVDIFLTWGTSKFSYVPVAHTQRLVGESNYTFAKLVFTAFNMITGFTTIPLRIATINGLICVTLGVLLLFYVLYKFVENGGSVPGFPFIASVTIIFSGAQLFALGIIGEYLARMYTKMLNKPSYVIDEIAARKTEFTPTEISSTELSFEPIDNKQTKVTAPQTTPVIQVTS